MDYSTDPDTTPLCPTCGARLDASCRNSPNSPCDWLSDPDFPAHRLNNDGNVVEAD